MLTPRVGRCGCAACVLPDARLSAQSGEYLDDLSLVYIVRSAPEEISRVYDILARSPIVDTVYYNPIPWTP
jgi:hypothetical protein